MKSLIERFNSVNSLKVNLEKEIEDTEFQIKEYSNMLGEKIRSNEESSADDPDFIALKAKLAGEPPKSKSDDKKIEDKKANDKKTKTKPEKKKKGKKGISDKWYNLNEILVYNGIGLKGELELYFKAVDELKAKLENLQRTLSTLSNVMEKGLKEDMGCVAFRGKEGILEITFLKSSGMRENFTLKSIYSGKAIPVDNMIKIGV
ncbi:hypothetical protein [Nitrosopumilus sp.]|uniref:hypothetical protein n=1 Tax=Nitrosopumilus sp. TaxID=2024843 RepID=UPI00247C1682|nr:hypothetical protein [Nitrosopumilus sp.]MCV0430088.1 hypothetical protein [Nitrosopumilus sp.]